MKDGKIPNPNTIYPIAWRYVVSKSNINWLII